MMQMNKPIYLNNKFINNVKHSLKLEKCLFVFSVLFLHFMIMFLEHLYEMTMYISLFSVHRNDLMSGQTFLKTCFNYVNVIQI